LRDIPILITSSVYVSTSLAKVNDAKLRVNLVLESIKHWIKITQNSKIILCDGSGFDFTEDVVAIFPKAEIECLHFNNDKNCVALYGKGYGEGQIIQFALMNSKVLNNSKEFVKCTGKLWVENFAQIIDQFEGDFQCQLSVKNYFSIRKIRPFFVDTRFYIANRDFYLRNLLHSHLRVRDSEGYYLEHCFADSLIKNRIKVSSFLFKTPPVIRGVSGSSGEIYGVENLTKRWFTNRLKSVFLGLHELLFT
jgi:hypothetical protein